MLYFKDSSSYYDIELKTKNINRDTKLVGPDLNLDLDVRGPIEASDLQI